MKIKLHSEDELSLNKTIKVPGMIIIVMTDFHENSKYYPQFFLDKCKNTKILYDDIIEASEWNDVNKTSESKECNICHWWYFLNKVLQ